MVAGNHILRQPRKADGSLFRRTLHRFGGQGEQAAFGQRHLRLDKGSQPDFRSFGVDQHRHRQIQLFAQLFHHIDPLAVASVILMGHVDARHIHTRQHQLA